jgi:hypothetical protein
MLFTVFSFNLVATGFLKHYRYVVLKKLLRNARLFSPTGLRRIINTYLADEIVVTRFLNVIPYPCKTYMLYLE